MKQVLQSLKDGRTEVASVPCPAVKSGQLLVASSRTLISAGTERTLVSFGKASLVSKARREPERVRAVLDKIRTDGVLPTIEAVLAKLDQPLPMGYCNVGVVTEVAEGVTGYAVGERVVSNGKHAEMVAVPANLCAKVPDGVSDDAAAFTVIGAIALQGIRLVQPTLGEAVVVTGLGLVGLMTVQLLRAHGCRVLGLDFDRQRLELAQRFGAEVADIGAADPVAAARSFSRGRGVDAVLVTASTASSEPLHQAALMCRKRGRIVLVGVAGLELSRADFYEKELTFQVSCSYGPGRYDPAYEEGGVDYPIGFVRWTEQRNFEAVLDMLADGRIDVEPLISHRYSINDAVSAYDLVDGSEPSLGILLEYAADRREAGARTVPVRPSSDSVGPRSTHPEVAVGFIGAGSYAASVLIPAFKIAGARLRSVASNAGVSGLHAARKFGFEETTTDTARLLADPGTDALVISTRHDSHAALVCEGLRAGKHVFVEKPLAMSVEEVQAVEDAYRASRSNTRILMVGFNRRFAPHVAKIHSLLRDVAEPKAFVMTVNAGAIPGEHWTQDRAVGGGRILGEACHFIDLLRFLAGAPIEREAVTTMRSRSGDTATISLGFADGSIGTIHYFANGSKSVPKERLEVFVSGRVLQLDNFRKLVGFGWPKFGKMALWRQDKGQRACAKAFIEAVAGGRAAPIPIDELLEVARVTIAVSKAAAG
jgi:predicted dehydrogenase/NADPH:quinone reductase-like Zn-dependent oxidoreductase